MFGAFTEILAGCAVLLRPGGIATVTVCSVRRSGLLDDLPGRISATANAAGLGPADRAAALTGTRKYMPD
jgi:modification methylase